MKRIVFSIVCVIVLISLFRAYTVFVGGGKDHAKKSKTGQVKEPSVEEGSISVLTKKLNLITITDSLGREVTLNHPVKRVAFGHISVGEALILMNAWDLVKGRSKKLDPVLFPAQDKISVVVSGQNSYDLNYEKIFELDIDLFIATDMLPDSFYDVASVLEPDVPIAAFNFYDPALFKENFKNLGLLLGKEKEVTEYIEWFDNVKENISTKTATLTTDERPAVFYKLGWGAVDDIQTFSDDFLGAAEGSEITGCVNISGDLPSISGWVQNVDGEWLSSQKVDALIVFDPVPGGYGAGISDMSTLHTHSEKIMELAVFSESNAVKNNQVYLIEHSYGKPSAIIGYAYIAKWLHPILFKEFDPQAIHQEYLERFMRIDIDLSERGTFVYPKP